MSRKALEIFVKELLPKNCGGLNGESDTGSEDLSAGICLHDHAIFVDCRDEKHEKRFFPIGMETHTWGRQDMSYWYFQDLYYNATQGNLDCCSDKMIQLHYIGPKELHKLEYLIYRVHPFGLEDNPALDILPRKLSIDEIIAASNAKSERREHKDMGIAR